MIELNGEIVWNSEMWTSRIYQRGRKFYLAEQSEMMDEPSHMEFDSLEAAFKEMLSHT